MADEDKKKDDEFSLDDHTLEKDVPPISFNNPSGDGDGEAHERADLVAPDFLEELPEDVLDVSGLEHKEAPFEDKSVPEIEFVVDFSFPSDDEAQDDSKELPEPLVEEEEEPKVQMQEKDHDNLPVYLDRGQSENFNTPSLASPQSDNTEQFQKMIEILERIDARMELAGNSGEGGATLG